MGEQKVFMPLPMLINQRCMVVVIPCPNLAGLKHAMYFLSSLLVFSVELLPIDGFAFSCGLVNIE